MGSIAADVNTFNNENNIDNTESESKKVGNVILDGFYKSLIFIFIFLMFVFNMMAVSISLQCNRDQGMLFKLSSSLFAFMFGILYIIVNYYMYRVRLKGYPCDICSNDPFPLK